MYMVFLVSRSSIYLNICNCHKVHLPMRCEPPFFVSLSLPTTTPRKYESSHILSLSFPTSSLVVSLHMWYIHSSHTNPQQTIFGPQNNILTSLVFSLTGQEALSRKLSNRRATSLTQHSLLLGEPVPRCVLIVIQLQRHTSNVRCAKEEPVRLAIISEDSPKIASSPLGRDLLFQTPVQGRPLGTATSHLDCVVRQIRREALDFVAMQPLITTASVFRSPMGDASLRVMSRSWT